MSRIRTFDVSTLARVEGQGALRVRIDDGRVEIAEFNIYEPPRFFERLLRGRAVAEVPDIVARICGICPVAYQMTACQALEKALGIETTPAIRTLRRLLYCGEWIQSHALHVHLLHAPDFLGFESGFTMAATHPELIEGGLRLKAIGSRLLEVVGGRAVHPVNVCVGGFHRPPASAAIRELLPDLEWGLGRSLELVREVSRFEFPDGVHRSVCVALRSADEYPMNKGRVVSSAGLEIDVADFERHFEERQVAHSTALHCVRLPEGLPYEVGPVARLNLCHEQLPAAARRAAAASGLTLPIDNSFHSIVVRCVEMAAAFEEAVAIAKTCRADESCCRIDYEPRGGAGIHATEAPRGLLYHRYRIGADGLIAEATIIPPTSQNQAQIEDDLRSLLPSVLGLDDAAAALRCERLIRNYDPCISCATHFLKLAIDRVRPPAAD